ncbi:MAG: hypothetical protein M1436_10470 [Acidobacteria bacterium]|nr:hypothetical protein [Acidobacteriota bacterium]
MSRTGTLPWIRVARGAPYFVTEEGDPWTPIGQNDAISWPDLEGAFRRKNLPAVEAYFRFCAAHGVTCLRLMLEYSQKESRYLEQPAGRFKPHVVALWDDLFQLAERHGVRFLLTPFDTFWMWRRWKRHPYNRANGGPCAGRDQLLLCPATRRAMEARLEFATRRWGSSGVIFAWDLWNEIHPAHAGNSAQPFAEFISSTGSFLRSLETRLHGRAHPQTVSVFGPHMVLDPAIKDSIFRHACLDFASTHFYDEGTIDCPANTVDAAVSTGRLMREALAEIRDDRPLFDSEHGPIHTFKDHHKTLPAPFDDEYFRHMQWAHFASGGAGGGMRWPNRKPHCLTPGMRLAQRALAGFLPQIDWRVFRRANWNTEARVNSPHTALFACGDGAQAVVYLLRKDTLNRAGLLRRDAPPLETSVCLPAMQPGVYRVTAWDTVTGKEISRADQSHSGGPFSFRTPPVTGDTAFAIRSC